MSLLLLFGGAPASGDITVDSIVFVGVPPRSTARVDVSTTSRVVAGVFCRASGAVAAISTIARTVVGLAVRALNTSSLPTPTDPDRIVTVRADNRRTVVPADARGIIIPLEIRSAVTS